MSGLSNYKDWIKNIDVDIDYFAAFLKAYIAFNSWYKEQYPEKTDRAAIDTLKESDNVFRRYVVNLISMSSSDENLTYHDNFGKLHNALCNGVITTQEFGGVRKQISFSDIAIKNTSPRESHEHRRVKYTVKREQGLYKTEIKKLTGVILLSENQEKHDFDELASRTSFQALTIERRAQAEQCYYRIRPYFSRSVLFSGENRGQEDENVRKIGIYEFVNDDILLSKAIIEIIYLLRCSLAHGDISPDKNANNVYRYAYELLAITLKKMI